MDNLRAMLSISPIYIPGLQVIYGNVRAFIYFSSSYKKCTTSLLDFYIQRDTKQVRPTSCSLQFSVYLLCTKFWRSNVRFHPHSPNPKYLAFVFVLVPLISIFRNRVHRPLSPKILVVQLFKLPRGKMKKYTYTRRKRKESQYQWRFCHFVLLLLLMGHRPTVTAKSFHFKQELLLKPSASVCFHGRNCTRFCKITATGSAVSARVPAMHDTEASRPPGPHVRHVLVARLRSRSLPLDPVTLLLWSPPRGFLSAFFGLP
jgi:hypothetical protein